MQVRNEPRPQLIRCLLGKVAPPLPLPVIPTVRPVSVPHKVRVVVWGGIRGRRVVPIEGVRGADGEGLHARGVVEGLLVVGEGVVAERLVVRRRLKGRRGERAGNVVVVRVRLCAEERLLALVDDMRRHGHVWDVRPAIQLDGAVGEVHGRRRVHDTTGEERARPSRAGPTLRGRRPLRRGG